MKALNPSHHLSSPTRHFAAARAEPTVQGQSSKTTAPFGAFILTEGAQETDDTDVEV
jgi:hypothetical protein